MLGKAPPTAHLVAVLASGVGSALSAKHLLALVALVRPIVHKAAFIARYLIALLLHAYLAVVSLRAPLSVETLWLQLPPLILARAEVR